MGETRIGYWWRNHLPVKSAWEVANSLYQKPKGFLVQG